MQRTHFLELRIPPPVVAVAVGLLMWLVATRTAPVPLPRGLRVALALALAAIGVGLAGAGVATFRRARTTISPLTPDATSALVRTGVYRMTRNPMYLGMLLCLSAWAVYLSNALSLLLAGVFVLYMNRFQIAPEERALTAIFGEAYDTYRREVRRW
jgi:protein-S-isoprenylcysteine O-methyltransferase Ste14